MKILQHDSSIGLLTKHRIFSLIPQRGVPPIHEVYFLAVSTTQLLTPTPTSSTLPRHHQSTPINKHPYSAIPSTQPTHATHPAPTPRPLPPPRPLSLFPHPLHPLLRPPNRARLPLHTLPARNRNCIRAECLLRARPRRARPIHGRKRTRRGSQDAGDGGAEFERRRKGAGHGAVSGVLYCALE